MAPDQAGPIVVVQTTQNPASRKRLAAFATGKPYPVLIKGMTDGTVVNAGVEVRSIGGGVDASENWNEVERLFCQASYVISNTADRGYESDPADCPDRPVPRSIPAKQTKHLLARHRADAGPLTL